MSSNTRITSACTHSHWTVGRTWTDSTVLATNPGSCWVRACSAAGFPLTNECQSPSGCVFFCRELAPGVDSCAGSCRVWSIATGVNLTSWKLSVAGFQSLNLGTANHKFSKNLELHRIFLASNWSGCWFWTSSYRVNAYWARPQWLRRHLCANCVPAELWYESEAAL